MREVHLYSFGMEFFARMDVGKGHKQERKLLHSQTDIQGCYAGRSVLTKKVHVGMPPNLNSFNHLTPCCSGQLRNLGLSHGFALW